MRVSGGKWSGRQLKHSGRSPVRPTSGRVKEMLFNILAQKIVGSHVIDLCCGTGSLGIEALSRGAAFVSFVDISPDSLKSTASNLNVCTVDTDNHKLYRSDSIRFIKSKFPVSDNVIVLADPPYNSDMTQNLWQEMVKCIVNNNAITIVLEHKTGIELSSGSYAGTVDIRKAGNSSLAILER